MTNSMSLAEMANTADYSAMTYNGLLELNVAFNWGLMSVKSNLESKRLEEMSNITHAYVVAMNGYGATKTEIMSCIEKEEMREKPMFSDIYDDVDDQSATDEAVIIREEGEDVLAPPEPPAGTMEDECDPLDTTVAFDENNGEETNDMDSMEPNTNEESASTHDDNKGEENSSEDTLAPTVSQPYSNVVEILRTLPIQEDVNVNVPYFAEYLFDYDENGELKYHNRKIKYMSNEDLESFKYAAKRYVDIIHKDTDMISTDNYLVYYNNVINSIIGIIYNTPEENVENVVCENLGEEPNNDSLSIENLAEKKKELKKMHAKMRKAMKLLAEYSGSNGIDANNPSYDRCIFKASTGNPEICGDLRNIEEDVETLSEMISVFETYTKFYYDKCEILSKDDCFAMLNPAESRIYVFKVNIPEHMRPTKTGKKHRKVVTTTPASGRMDSKESCSSDESWSSLVDSDGNALNAKETDIVKMVVETVEGFPVAKGTDSSMSYYVSHVFMYSNGDLKLVAGPVGWNMKIEALANLKEAEAMRNRTTYKRVKIVCYGDYVVYLTAGNTVIVSQFNMDNEYVWEIDMTEVPREVMEMMELAKCNNEFEYAPEQLTNNESAMENESKTTSNPNKEEAFVKNAVEKVKSMSVGNVVNADAPYFTKCEFSIGDNDELEEGRPFARNIDTDKMEGIKESHKRCAETYKASYVSHGGDYTAFIYNEGKSMCVYCYHSNEAQG